MDDNYQIIEIVMDVKNSSISITNNTSGSQLIIEPERKQVKASDFYNVLNYYPGSKYKTSNNINEIEDKANKTYFMEIINLVSDIIAEINDIEYILPEVESIKDKIDV